MNWTDKLCHVTFVTEAEYVFVNDHTHMLAKLSYWLNIDMDLLTCVPKCLTLNEGLQEYDQAEKQPKCYKG